MSAEWAGWEHDEKLVAEYTRRITAHFHAALAQFATILEAWWSGSLTMTTQGLGDTLEDLLRESLGSVLHNLWQEAWYLGSRSAAIAISHDASGFGKWKPGRLTATAAVADEAGLRHLLGGYGRSVVEGIARTRMDKLDTELRAVMATTRNPADLTIRLEDILLVSARAPMIARTEIARAVAAAAVDEYRKAGISRKEWVPEAAACPVCKENAAQGAIPFSTNFIGGVHSPPQHPFCRCALVPDQSQAVKQRKVKPPKSTWGGGWGGGARSSPHEEGGRGYQPDQNYTPDQPPTYNPQQPPTYDPDELYIPGQAPSTADQRSGTSAPLSSPGNEPPRTDLDDDKEDQDEDAQVDVNGQRTRRRKRTSNAGSYPYGERGLPGGAPQGPEHGTQQPQGDPFSLPRRRGAETSQSGNDGDYPPRRGRPPNATGKALAELGALAQHLREGGALIAWEPQELPQSVLDVVKFDLADGQTLATAMEDALLHLTTKRQKVSKESVNYKQQAPGKSRRCGNCIMYSSHVCDLVAGRIEPADVCDKWEARKDDHPSDVTHAGLVVRAADTGRILLLQRAID